MSDAQAVRILVVGDPYMPAQVFRDPLEALGSRVNVDYLQLTDVAPAPPRTPSEARIQEYAGSPDLLLPAIRDSHVLVVHGAPVTDTVLGAGNLRLVCCARGGPVNVDVAAATERGIPVTSTPGKNARAVADLTAGFLLMLIRRVPGSVRRLLSEGALSESVFDGREFFGREPDGLVLGLVGYGQVGQQVAARARALGMRLLVTDPVTDPVRSAVAGDDAEWTDLDGLLQRSDVVSVHARATAGNRHMFGAAQFGRMRTGSFFINTARESLVDEAALLAALRSGHLAGAALDVLERPAGGGRNPLLDEPSAIVTPHIGGATAETLRRGADMAAASIADLLEGRPPAHLVNPRVLDAAGGLR